MEKKTTRAPAKRTAPARRTAPAKRTTKTAPRPGGATVDAYLASVPPAFRAQLEDVRRAIRTLVPDATESISYGIPGYKYNGRPLIYFSAAKEHLAVHALSDDVIADAEGRGFSVGRGAIRFTPERPIPKTLLTRAIRQRLAEIERGAGGYKSRERGR